MKLLLLLTLGAASTFARNIDVSDAEALEFLHLLDVDGDGAATLQEVTDKLNLLDVMLGNQLGLPSVSSILPIYVYVSIFSRIFMRMKKLILKTH